MTELNVDVIICGSGLVGATLAIALAQNNVQVAVIDHSSSTDYLNSQYDGRTTAASYGSQQIFAELGVWNYVADQAQPILEIRVCEDGSPWTVDYDHKDVGSHPMGYIVENLLLRQALQKQLDHKNIHYFAPVSIKHTKRLEHRVDVELNSGETLIGKLLVGAEGRFSPTRTQSTICTKSWDYNQIALVTHITHEKSHNGTAWEIFLPSGPLAILPMLTCPNTRLNRSGIVWVKPRNHNWSTWDDEELAKNIENHFSYYDQVKVCQKRWIYPLSAMSLNKIIDHRLAIIGDAAHVVHPIAGQGVNLGWRDAKVLADVLVEAKSVGLDIGSATILQKYQSKRKSDHRSVLWMTDDINRLFSNNSSILHFVRNTGFALVNQIHPLKRYLMKRAMGL